MSDYPRLVHWRYFNGQGLFSSKNTKESMTEIHLLDEKGEEILKGGLVACLNSSGLYDTVGDPYFKLTRTEGFTRRASKYGKLARDMRESHPEKEDVLRGTRAKVMGYGDYVYINLAYLDNLENPLVKDNPKFYNKNFVYKKHFNKEFLMELVNYTPRALMGGVITSYRKEELPEFFAELKIKMPELYKEVLEESEWLKTMDKELTLVGKKAKVVSLSKGNVEVELSVLDKEVFYWDGHKLVNNKKLRTGEVVYQEIIPTSEMVVTIDEDVVVNGYIELVE